MKNINKMTDIDQPEKTPVWWRVKKWNDKSQIQEYYIKCDACGDEMCESMLPKEHTFDMYMERHATDFHPYWPLPADIKETLGGGMFGDIEYVDYTCESCKHSIPRDSKIEDLEAFFEEHQCKSKYGSCEYYLAMKRAEDPYYDAKCKASRDKIKLVDKAGNIQPLFPEE